MPPPTRTVENDVRTPAVHHLAVKVRDLVRAEAFYGGVLGLAVQARHDDAHGRPRALWMTLDGGAFLAVERAAEGAPGRADDAHGWHCVALGIAPSERESWRARLTERGHPVVHETDFTLYVRDPEGALVALSHHPHRASPPERQGVADTGAPTVAPSRRAGSKTTALAVLAALGLAVGVAVTPTAGAQRRRAPAAPPEAIVLGSSSVNGALGRMIESELVGAGLRVQRMGHSSTGFARPDFFDWQAEIARLGDLNAMRGVVVYMGGNDTQALRVREGELESSNEEWIQWRDEARWTTLYSARVRSFVEGLCEGGLRRAVVVLPSEGERGGWSDRIRRVQAAQAEGVRGTRCGVVVDPRGGQIREGDTVDGIHLSRQGARTLLLRIGPPIVAAIAG